MEKSMILNLYPTGSIREKIENKFKTIMRDELKLRSLVSYVGNKNIPFLRIYRYKEAFAFDFVKYFLNKFKTGFDDYIFDPFSGMGTTLFVSMFSRIHSIGIDKLPLAYFISKTIPLFLLLEENEIMEIWRSLKQKIATSIPVDIPINISIMQKAFNKKNLLILRKLKSAIDDLPDPYHDIFLLLFFSILEECSFTSKDGQFLRIKRDKKVSNPINAMNKKVMQVEEDIRRKKIFYPHLVNCKKYFPDIYLADTRDLSKVNFKRKPTIIITSPPYVNRYDYTRIYSLELCFHFIKNFKELKDIRFGILRSHIESKIEKDEAPTHPAIREIIENLSRKKLNNPKIPNMIIAYFIDMEKAIREWYKVLAPDAKIAMVVDNVRFEGEMIPVDLILSEIAEEIGFAIKEIIIARYKGNSSQQMKKYGKVPVRESVVIWEK
ncbi:MAG: hypothetical protein ACTSRP_20950 [Candidatus Helarchaeota archaeon]